MISLELFAGAGGLAMGVARAGFAPAAILEWNRWCCDTLRDNRRRAPSPLADWPEPWETDVAGVDFRPFEGRIDLLSGGPPCQPFSLGGRHGAQDDGRDMWPQAIRAVREARPRAFLLENVKGLTRPAFAPYLDYVVLRLRHPSAEPRRAESWTRHLERLRRHDARHAPDYLVAAPRVLDAADYGAPQRRQRVFLVGLRADLGLDWSFPAPTHSAAALAWSQRPGGDYWARHRVPARARAAIHDAAPAPDGALPWRTVRDAIGDLPDPQREAARAARVANHLFQPGARPYPGHTGSRPDAPAKTLKAGVHGVPGGENMLASPDGAFRYFTVRESARLQTFPDDFVFHGAWSECMRQLGNAVPVVLAETLAREIARLLATARACEQNAAAPRLDATLVPV